MSFIEFYWIRPLKIIKVETMLSWNLQKCYGQRKQRKKEIYVEEQRWGFKT